MLTRIRDVTFPSSLPVENQVFLRIFWGIHFVLMKKTNRRTKTKFHVMVMVIFSVSFSSCFTSSILNVSMNEKEMMKKGWQKLSAKCRISIYGCVGTGEARVFFTWTHPVLSLPSRPSSSKYSERFLYYPYQRTPSDCVVQQFNRKCLQTLENNNDGAIDGARMMQFILVQHLNFPTLKLLFQYSLAPSRISTVSFVAFKNF